MKKRKGTITIHKLNSKKYPFGVDFWGFNEGSGSPCIDEKEIKKEVENLIKRHQKKYVLKVIDKRERQEVLK